MIPPGLWAGFLYVVWFVGHKAHKKMCLIFALLTANNLKRTHMTTNKNNDDSMQRKTTAHDDFQ